MRYMCIYINNPLYILLRGCATGKLVFFVERAATTTKQESASE